MHDTSIIDRCVSFLASSPVARLIPLQDRKGGHAELFLAAVCSNHPLIRLRSPLSILYYYTTK